MLALTFAAHGLPLSLPFLEDPPVAVFHRLGHFEAMTRPGGVYRRTPIHAELIIILGTR